MNILILCRDGVRGCCLASSIEKRGHETRWKTAMITDNQVTFEDKEWADMIIILDEWIMNMFDSFEKLVFLDKMPGIFFDPDQKELRDICRYMMPYLARYNI